MPKTPAFLLLCLLPCVTFAQHSKAEKSGLYNFPYKGDTWTGKIIAIDTNAHTLSLQYTDKKGQSEEFTAKALPSFKVHVKDRPEQRVLRLHLGDKLIVYYIAVGQKYPVPDEHGKRKDVAATENLVFEAELIPPKEEKK